MLIIRSVAEAGGMTTTNIITGGRNAGLCHARAAVYKIASKYGYNKEEIMFFLDRNRTVAYNYEANINGHLLRNAKFKTLCNKATRIINKHPHRVTKVPEEPQNAQKKSHSKHSAKAEAPTFEDWKGKLGWTFTAEECRREWYAKRAAEEFIREYCKTPNTQSTIEHRPRKAPAEMKTADAVVYLGISTRALVRGAQIGRLHRFKKPGDTSYWFYTAELDQYKTYIEINQINKKAVKKPKYNK